MALKNLIIDQDVLQEQLIEDLLSTYIRYDINNKAVVFVPEKINELSSPHKIVIYLLALKGWKYVSDSLDVSLVAKPKDIAGAIMENGSTIRSHLQILLKKGLIQKSSAGYSIPPIAINMVRGYLQSS